MKKILVALATVTTIAATPAHADAGAFIGGLIIGNILTQPRTVYVQPAPVYIPPPQPVYANPNPWGFQPNPYLLRCWSQPIYNQWGQIVAYQQACQ